MRETQTFDPFFRSAEEVITGLTRLRKALCQYGPDAVRCDCKFMNDRADFGRGEQSGCPEAMAAIELIRTLLTALDSAEEVMATCSYAIDSYTGPPR